MFLPTVSVAYFATPHRFRWLTLLVASAVFYMAFVPASVLILLALIGVDYVSALVIERLSGRPRRWALVFSLVSNIGVLAVFKYYDFAARTLTGIAAAFGLTISSAPLGWLLPIGLSFHTFQSMAYTIEVYRGRVPAERHLGRYALYVLFYPQLVAGPIERPATLLPQFCERHEFDPRRAEAGLKLIAWGLFKKVVIADRLAGPVNAVYGLPSAHYGPSVVLATLFFAFQIYCDFSGYTDIAIGAAEIMGFRLVTNFRRPYLARSIRDFWSRWHISLSTWFRDYVYIPLGGNRTRQARWMFNIMATFLLSGLWHGANWTYLVWGALHGVYLVAGETSAPLRGRIRAILRLPQAPRLLSTLQMSTTFLLVTVAWVFFRAGSIHDAVIILSRMFDWSVVDLDSLGLTRGELMLSLALIAGLWSVERLMSDDDVRVAFSGQPAWIRWPAYYGVITATLVLGVFNQSKFIYFQF